MTLLTGQIIPRQDTAANWTDENPVLGSFEIGFETDTRLSKRGDNSTAWNDLPYEVTASSDSHLVSGGSIAIVTDDITVAEATYFISGFGTYTSPETVFNNITLSATGLVRYVAFYGKTDSTVVKVEGTEGAVASMPAGPANSILVNYSLVTDGAIGSGVDLSGYLLRSDKATGAEVVTGTNDTKYITPAAMAGAKGASGGYVGLTLFKINFKNALNTFTSFFTNSNTAARTYTFPDSDLTVVGRDDTATVTNKRVTKRRVVVTQSATPTINTDNTDIASITGLAQAITSFTTNLSGTPVAGDMMMIQITDNGTARTITWGASFQSTTGAVLPTTTVISTMLRVLFQWNAVASKWDCIGVC